MKTFDRVWIDGKAGWFRYAILADTSNTHVVQFKVFERIGIETTGERRPIFNRKGYKSSPDPVYSTDEAQPFLNAYVKWDGCSDWNFEDEPSHFCSKESAAKLGLLVECLYEIAKELMPETWME